MYTKKVMKQFKKLKNLGEIKNPDGMGTIGNPVCGDVIQITIKIKNDIIKDIKFKTMGCVAAIATSSKITEIVKGKTIKQALKITNADVAKSLGGLPDEKMHCSNLAAAALKKAIQDYKKKAK